MRLQFHCHDPRHAAASNGPEATQSMLAGLTWALQIECSAASTKNEGQVALAAARELRSQEAGRSWGQGLHTSVLMLTWRRICRSVLTSMEGSRCTPTQTPFTKIFVACIQVR